MRNLTRRYLILVGEDCLDDPTLLPRFSVDDSVGLHGQRVVIRQQLRAKAQFLCLMLVIPEVAALCAFLASTQVSWLALYFARRVSQMLPVHWIAPA